MTFENIVEKLENIGFKSWMLVKDCATVNVTLKNQSVGNTGVAFDKLRNQ